MAEITKSGEVRTSVDAETDLVLVGRIDDTELNTRPIKLNDEWTIHDSSANRVDYPCGHTGPAKYWFSAYGETSKVFNSKDEKCPGCMEAFVRSISIRCARCGRLIFEGGGICLWSAQTPGLHLKIGTKIEDDFVGCLRMDCCPSGGLICGHWTKEGIKPLAT